MRFNIVNLFRDDEIMFTIFTEWNSFSEMEEIRYVCRFLCIYRFWETIISKIDAEVLKNCKIFTGLDKLKVHSLNWNLFDYYYSLAIICQNLSSQEEWIMTPQKKAWNPKCFSKFVFIHTLCIFILY